MTTSPSNAINITALLDDSLPGNLYELAAKYGVPVDDAEQWPDTAGDTRVTELRISISYRMLTF